MAFPGRGRKKSRKIFRRITQLAHQKLFVTLVALLAILGVTPQPATPEPIFFPLYQVDSGGLGGDLALELVGNSIHATVHLSESIAAGIEQAIFFMQPGSFSVTGISSAKATPISAPGTGFVVGEFEQRQLKAIREELNRAHAARTRPAVRPIPNASPSRLSSKART